MQLEIYHFSATLNARDNSDTALISVPRLSSRGQVEDSMDTAEERSQALCGKYITEIWSDDVHGFPHPDGCCRLRSPPHQSLMDSGRTSVEYGILSRQASVLAPLALISP